MKKIIAVFLCFTLLLGGCFAGAVESAEGNFNTQVNKKQVISERLPANNAEVSLVNIEVESFLKNYSFGKGLGVAESRKEDIALSVPVTLSWKCDKENTGFTVIYTTREDFSDAVQVDVTEPELILEDLFVATTYYWQVVTHTAKGDNYSTVFCFKTAETPRLITIDGVNNTRDIGGYLTEDGKYRVAQGMIYRGARLNDLISDEGIQKAANVYKIKTDLDLRRMTDNGYSDVTPLMDANYINTAVVDYSGAYSHQEEMRQAIALLAEAENYPMYVHCTAGRDRTGTMLYIVGALLGVPENSLCADFELTYLTARSYAKNDLSGHEAFIGFLNNFKQYEGATLQEKAESYCKSIGLTDAQIQAIRANLLVEVN